MINEAALLESRSLRDDVVDRTHVIDTIKPLSLLPDGMHVTTSMVATYFEVAETVIRAVVFDHREELEGNGYRVLTGPELSYFKQLSGIRTHTASLALFSRRTVLNVAMLLRDSNVARQVRAYLLDTEYTARNRPVDNSVHNLPADLLAALAAGLDNRIDQRVTHILGTTVVPLLNALIESAGEQRRGLLSAREDIHRAQRKLAQHEQKPHRLERARARRPLTGSRPPARSTASTDAMTGREFAQHVAEPLRRDGCTDVEIDSGGDRDATLTARTADGRGLVARCGNRTPHRAVGDGEMREFVGTKALHRADVAVYVATRPFSREAHDVAAQAGVTAVHRGLLEAWSAGTVLQALR
ncbi:Restriction endonuclease [Streptomyces sp. BpilaLS-43]|nr:restriction endonuclease [Streptomyces sp. BpilaLS-43]SCD31866.1 Restriction endonuclease [Streptomyces sp. BpilaLS-43]